MKTANGELDNEPNPIVKVFIEMGIPVDIAGNLALVSIESNNNINYASEDNSKDNHTDYKGGQCPPL